MDYKIMGIKILATFIVLVIITIKGYLIIGRRLPKGERELFWLAIKLDVHIFIAIITISNAIYGWFNITQNEFSDIYVDVYLYFLIFINSIIGVIDDKKEYKKKKNEVRK